MQTAIIKDLCVEIKTGGTPSRKNLSFFQGDIPWIKTGELKGWYIDKTKEKITPEAILKSSAKLLPKDTVLVAMYGDGDTMGNVGILREEMSCNQACCALILDKNKCDPLYILNLLQFNKSNITKLAVGGAQRNLNLDKIKNFKIKINNIDIQKKISNIFYNCDYLIEYNNYIIEKIEIFIENIFNEYFEKLNFSKA